MVYRMLERPILAVDVVLFRVSDGALEVLLVRRPAAGGEPFPGAMALPGIALRVDETLDEGAGRALNEKAGIPKDRVTTMYREQLATFDSLYRDPRGRTVSVAYLSLVRPDFDFGLSEDVFWKAVNPVLRGQLPFDHSAIISEALERLRGKLRYTNIAAALVPEFFRIEELQEVYELVLGFSLNRTNFRMKLLKIGLIKKQSILTDAVSEVGGRPPHLYRFVQKPLALFDRDFV